MIDRVKIAGFTASALIAALISVPFSSAKAEDYPSRAITLIVPYPPGGGVDVMGRLVGQKLSAALGQQVVIENRAGAGGMIGTRDIAKATELYRTTLGAEVSAAVPQPAHRALRQRARVEDRDALVHAAESAFEAGDYDAARDLARRAVDAADQAATGQASDPACVLLEAIPLFLEAARRSRRFMRAFQDPLALKP